MNATSHFQFERPGLDVPHGVQVLGRFILACEQAHA